MKIKVIFMLIMISCLIFNLTSFSHVAFAEKQDKEGAKAQKEEIKAQKQSDKEGAKAQKEEIKAQKQSDKEGAKAQKEEIKAQKQE